MVFSRCLETASKQIQGPFNKKLLVYTEKDSRHIRKAKEKMHLLSRR